MKRTKPTRRSLFLERLEDRTLLCGQVLPTATPLTLDAHQQATVVGSLPGTGVFSLTLTETGRLTTKVHATGADTRLSLLGPDGDLLIQSDGQSTTNRDDQIIQHVVPGTYFLEVTNLSAGTGAYTLTAQLQPASAPQQSLLVDFPHDYPFTYTPLYNIVGDFNGDGHPDIVTGNPNTFTVSVLLGLGDGTFQNARNFAVGAAPAGIVAGDFNGDGRLDLAVANAVSNDVSVLLGLGDGTFAPERRIAAGTKDGGLATADLNGDGHLDLVIGNGGSNDVSVLLGRGDGTFGPESRFAVGFLPFFLALGDFNGDGHPDIATSNYASNDISILLGRGDGTFGPVGRFATGANPAGIVTGDFNGDGHLDLASANEGSNDVSVLLGNGDGTFSSQGRWGTGAAPNALVPGDFDSDGRLDLAVANAASGDVSVLLGRGDGTFQDQRRYRAGISTWYIGTADFNGDGRLDLATTNQLSHDVSILLGLGDGTFQPDLTDPRQTETHPVGMVARDFNGDGILDLATVSYSGGDLSVYQGRGDGTFQGPARYAVGSTPVAIVSADFNGDGIPDLATDNCSNANITILLGRGDGTFRYQQQLPGNGSGEFLATEDFNGDGKFDLLSVGQFANGVALLLGNGDGTFQARQIFAEQYAPAVVAVGDFNGDAKLDVAFTDIFSPAHDVLVFLGHGDGTFQDPWHGPVGFYPWGVVVGDFNDDGRLDLAVANAGSDSVSILLGRGDGTFRPEVRYATGKGPDFLITDDFNGDGHLDLAVSNSLGTEMSILLGRGDGTFRDQVSFQVGDRPTPRRGLIVGDLNGDGKLDLAATELLNNAVSVLLGVGDGRFQQPLRFPVGPGPAALTAGHLNNDGRLDVASVHPTTNEVWVALGRGDTTLQDSVHFPVGLTPVAVAQGDFNSDGRLDLATANFDSNDVSVLLGLGDGTFAQELRLRAGRNPTFLAVGDVNGDGRLDLVSVNGGSNDVSLLLGQGHGTFQSPSRLPAGDLPQALVMADFNGDGHLDLAIANYRSKDVWVYLGRGDGTFPDPLRLLVGESLLSLVTGDFNDDGHLDLATANYRSNDVTVLLGRGNGTFQAPVRYATGTNPVFLVTGDFDDDGHLDLVSANSVSQDVTFLLGRGDGRFRDPVRRDVGDSPSALVAADMNSDGRLDLAIANRFSTDVSLLQGLGGATFAVGGTIASPFRATPLLIDWNGDGRTDVVVVNGQGRILLRLARPGAPGVFEAPVIVNPEPLPAARDLAIVSTGRGILLAALDAKRPSLSFYSRKPDGTFTWSAGPQIPGTLPVALAADDLNGDGRTDLVVADAGSHEVLVYLQNAAGSFGPAPDYRLAVGVSPSAIHLVDVDGDGRLDLAVTNQFSGDVSVLRNDPSAPFACELRFRAGTGLYSLDIATADPTVRSRAAPAGLVAGPFDADGVPDLIVTHSGSNSFALLRGSGAGGLLNPEQAPTSVTGHRPTVVVAGRFNNDSYLDLAILNEESGDLSIFLGDGQGGFRARARSSAGNLPSGLAVADVNGDGRLDLLVGNNFGDILTLLGNGDGSFQPYQRVGRNVALAVADLNGDGRDDFVFGNEALDRVSVQYSQPGTRFEQDRQDGLLAPGAVQVADLNRDGRPDLVVANSGANNVLVYLGIGNGQFGPAQSFFAGTNPVGLTLSYLNDQLMPLPVVGQGPVQLADPNLDLVVANQGSNDVTVLLGQGVGSAWSFRPGPRLRAGTGPVATVVQDVTGPQGVADGIPDILTANSQSNNVSLLPAVGQGFFSDQIDATHLFATGQSPQQVLVGNFDRTPGLDLLTINAGSNDLTLFPNFGTGRSLASGGQRPVAAVASDFDRDGTTDLLVANNEDGRITLLLGGAEGPALARVFGQADLLHPTALALGGDGSVLYVSGEGEELATRFLLDLATGHGEEGAAPVTLDLGIAVRTVGGGGLTALPPGGQVAELVPLRDSALATVALLLTVAGGTEAAASDRAGGANAAAAEPALGILVALAADGAQSQSELGGGDESNATDPPDEEPVGAGTTRERSTSLDQLLLGLDEALERRDQKFQQRLQEEFRRSAPLTGLKKILDQLWSQDLPAWVGELDAVGQGSAESLRTSQMIAQDLLRSWKCATDVVGDLLRCVLPEEGNPALRGGWEEREAPVSEPQQDTPTDRDGAGLDGCFLREHEGEAAEMPGVALVVALLAGAGREPSRRGRAGVCRSA